MSSRSFITSMINRSPVLYSHDNVIYFGLPWLLYTLMWESQQIPHRLFSDMFFILRTRIFLFYAILSPSEKRVIKISFARIPWRKKKLYSLAIRTHEKSIVIVTVANFFFFFIRDHENCGGLAKWWKLPRANYLIWDLHPNYQMNDFFHSIISRV